MFTYSVTTDTLNSATLEAVEEMSVNCTTLKKECLESVVLLNSSTLVRTSLEELFYFESFVTCKDRIVVAGQPLSKDRARAIWISVENLQKETS